MTFYICEDCDFTEEYDNDIEYCDNCGSVDITYHNSDDFTEDEPSCHSDSYWD